MLAVVSHDLRNPVSSILLSARLIEQHINPDDHPARRALAGLTRAAEGMRLLIGDLVDLVRIDSGQLVVHPEPEDSAALVREAVEFIAPLAAARHLALSVEIAGDAPRVLCDKDRILQVFSNLLGNAVKFTPPGGRVSVGVEDCTERARFSVSDNGPGLSPEHREHLFEPWGGYPPGSLNPVSPWVQKYRQSYQLDGQPEKVLRAGESLTTPDRAIHNEGALGQAVKLTAVYVVEKGKPLVFPAQ